MTEIVKEIYTIFGVVGVVFYHAIGIASVLWSFYTMMVFAEYAFGFVNKCALNFCANSTTITITFGPAIIAAIYLFGPRP